MSTRDFAQPRQTFNTKHPSSEPDLDISVSTSTHRHEFFGTLTLASARKSTTELAVFRVTMSTQYTTDIPFSASHKQQGFRLLELPPELLALLESDSPPKLSIISSPSTANNPGSAILCSGDTKYQMRQKNTSNPIMVMRPSSTGPTQADDTATFIPVPSVTAISKIEDTIELILQEGEKKAPPKVNKWHEKFAKSRVTKRI